MAYLDKANQALAAKRHYEANKPAMIEKAATFAKERKVYLTQVTSRIKDVPCTDCGVKYPPYVMDFDHVRGTKKYNVSSMVSRGMSEKTLLEEIAKCEVVCSNCHRARTYNRREDL